MRFYEDRSVREQMNRLPLELQQYYEKTQLDRIKIDGVELHGYFEYSFLEEKSYREQPIRSDSGVIENLNSYATFLTPRLIIRYNMMHIDDYRKLMKLLKSKNEFEVECYDIVEDKRVTHRMYFAPPSMPVIYQQYLMVLGIQEYTIELIGTNDTPEITYNYNIPSDIKATFEKEYGAVYTQTQSANYNAKTKVGDIWIPNKEGQEGKLEWSVQQLSQEYSLSGWTTNKDGSGTNYMDGNEYYISQPLTLYALWRER